MYELVAGSQCCGLRESAAAQATAGETIRVLQAGRVMSSRCQVTAGGSMRLLQASELLWSEYMSQLQDW